jgi:hypothetical protein
MEEIFQALIDRTRAPLDLASMRATAVPWKGRLIAGYGDPDRGKLALWSSAIWRRWREILSGV